MLRAISLVGLVCAPFSALACNPDVAPPLLPTEETFQKAAQVFEDPQAGKYARVAAYETMLTVQGAVFGTVLRDGYLSDDPDIISAATYCEMMRSNGAVARVTGLPKNADALSDNQKAQVQASAFTLTKLGADWDQGCWSAYRPPEDGCNTDYFVSVRDGTISFRSDRNTGVFTRVDGEFVGQIELIVGGPVYTVPAKLVLQ